MATEYKSKQFWKSNKSTDPETDYTSFNERSENILSFNKLKNKLADPTAAVAAAKELIRRKEEAKGSLISAGQVSSVLEIIRKNAEEKESHEISTSSLLEKYNDDPDSANLELDNSISPEMEHEVVEMRGQLKQVATKKLIKMYFDSYMAPMTSDIVWRLGTATDTVTADINKPSSGMVYTRSNIHVPYVKSFLHSSGDINQNDSSYTNLWFPPYKYGPQSKIVRSDKNTENPRLEDLNTGFDQKNFVVARDNLVYRDVGFKAINDYIQYLQWVTEGVTGIVSTDLTEWDLSVYMQENLMTFNENGNVLKIYLNYGIYTDNPLADEKGNYTDDKALCFNVAGSAVSKIEGDNKKIWRPSDYPYTVWWTPYENGKHFTLNNYVYSEDGEEVIKIPYMSIYDEVDSSFNYSENSTKNIIEHQDFLGLVLQSRHNTTNYFYTAFYYVPGEGVTEFEILSKSFVTKTAGMDDIASKTKYSIDHLIRKAKVNQISDGGWYGAPNDYGSNGGFLGKAMIEATMDSKQKNLSTQQPSKPAAQLADNSYSADVSKEDALTAMANKDASQMSDLTGICRWSPALFGGPHGADSSPNSAQGFFEEKSTVARNIPRLDPDFCYKDGNKDEFFFSSTNIEDYYKGVNSLYGPSNDEKDPNKKYAKGCSPSKTLSNLVNGYIETIAVPAYTKVDYVTYLPPVEIYYNAQTHTAQYAYDVDAQKYKVVEPAEYRAAWASCRVTSTKSTSKSRKYYDFDDFKIRIANQNSIYNESVPYLKVTYSATTFKMLDLPQPNDFPNVAWKIVQHNFEPKEGQEKANAWEGPFWSRVESTYGSYDVVDKYDELKEQTGFVLRLVGANGNGIGGFSSETEQKFVEQLLLNRGNSSEPVYLYFFAGSKSAEDVPTTMFRAPVYVRYYRNSFIRETKYNFFGKEVVHKHTPQYTYMPFIAVDLAKATVFEDALNYRAQSNIGDNGENTPVHLLSKIVDRTSIYRDNILQLFRQDDEQELDTVVSYTVKDSADASFERFFSDIGYVVERIWKFINNQKMNVVDENTEGIKIEWTSTAEAALYGYGMVSNIPGLNPDLPDNILSFSNSTNSSNKVSTATDFFDFKKLLCYTDKLKPRSGFNTDDEWFNQPVFNTPIDGLKLKFLQAKDFNSQLVISEAQAYQQYMSFGGALTSFKEVDAPEGIKTAIKNLYTRCRFWPDTNNGEPYAYIDMSVPFRNFLSVLITQRDFFSFAEDTLLNLISFSTMKSVLLNYVDRSVLKASGIKVEDSESGRTATLIRADKSHVLYNYWIEVAGKNFVEEKDFDKKTDEIKSEVAKIKGLYDYAIGVLQEICRKDTLEWTLKDFIDMYTQIAIIKEAVCSKSNKIDSVLFAYLNMLYYYRMYFIGHRFNKEDGTMWIMRSLESVLEMAAPTNKIENPPALNALEPGKKKYNVAFYEIQNSPEMKIRAATGRIDPLEKDAITTVYVKVDWVDEETYLKYEETKEGPRIKRIERVVDGDRIIKYAKLPENGDYQLLASEYLKNEMRLKWNAANPQERKKPCLDQDKVYLNIAWDELNILYDVFGRVNVENMLEYANDSISPEDLFCLMQEGADFWTIKLDDSQKALAELFRTKTILKPVRRSTHELTTATTTILGPSAFCISPIVRNLDNSEYGISDDVLKVFGAEL